jgi:hypothetical protein
MIATSDASVAGRLSVAASAVAGATQSFLEFG